MNALERVQYLAAYYDGRKTIDIPTEGFVTTAPGLVVQHKLDNAPASDPDWLVVHSRSGAAVGAFDEPEAAMWFAHQLAAMTDWTLPAKEALPADVKQAVRALLDDHQARARGPRISTAAVMSR